MRSVKSRVYNQIEVKNGLDSRQERMSMSKFVTLSFTHETESQFVDVMNSVLDHVKFDRFETHLEPLDGEPGYLTQVYLTGDVETILDSVRESYESKKINCGWSVDTLLD